MSPDVFIVENDVLKSVIAKSTGSVEILDKSCNAKWSPPRKGEPTGKLFVLYNKTAGTWALRERALNTCLNLSASTRITAHKTGKKSIHLIFENFVYEEGASLGGSVETNIRLEDKSVTFTVCKVEPPKGYTFLRLYYPWRCYGIPKGEEGYLIHPSKGGVMIPNNLPDIVNDLQEAKLLRRGFTADLTTELATFFPRDFSMPWYGVVKGTAGYIVTFESPDDGRVFFSAHDPRYNNELIMSPGCENCKMELKYPRSVTFTFISDANYVKMAKIFREYTMKRGYYRSLKDKIKENPLVKRVIGAPLIKLWIVDRLPRTGCWPDNKIGFRINTTYRDIQRILKELHDELSIDRAIILLAGWGPIGYDNVHPDIWPPGLWAGTMEDLRKARDMAEEYGYLFGLHDNYMDIYLESPSMDAGEMVVKTGETRGAGKTIHLGGVWEGGQAFIACSKWGHKNAKRNMPFIMEDLAPTCYFTDTTTAHMLEECYDANHPLTRTEDKQWKIKLIKYFTNLGMVYGSEGGTYWGVLASTFNEGIMTIGMHGVNVPLWNLVYHDAGVSYWHQGATLVQGATRTKFLLDLLYGNPTNWTMAAKDERSRIGIFKSNKKNLKNLAPVAMKLHRKIAFDEMVDHKFLTKNYLVQQTKFSSGVIVTINLGKKDYITPEGETIKARSYLIKE